MKMFTESNSSNHGRLSRRTQNYLALLLFSAALKSLSDSPKRPLIEDVDNRGLSSSNFSWRLLQELSDVRKEQTASDDMKRAIFLISLGEEAAKTTLRERCVLSIRRRGDFHGPVIILTDAPSERYEGVFDENVFILNSNVEYMKSNYFRCASTKYKRFKTLILKYVDTVPKLEGVQWVCYMDIDVMMGAPFIELIEGLDGKYHIEAISADNANGEKHEVENTISKLYMFKNLNDSFFVNSGFIIMNRRTSRFCLDLWRKEIDSRPMAKYDQESLNEISLQIEMGEETKCQLVPMELDSYLSYPRTDLGLIKMLKESS